MTLTPHIGFIPFVATDEFDITREILYRVLKTPFTAHREGIPLIANTLCTLLDFQAEAMFDCHFATERWKKAHAEYIWEAVCRFKAAERSDLYTKVVTLLLPNSADTEELIDSIINLLYEVTDEINNQIQDAAAHYKRLQQP